MTEQLNQLINDKGAYYCKVKETNFSSVKNTQIFKDLKPSDKKAIIANPNFF